MPSREDLERPADRRPAGAEQRRRGNRARRPRGLRADRRALRGARRRDRRDRAAERAPRHLRLLRARAGRGVGQPRPLRRGPLRPAGGGRLARRDVRADPLGRLRPRGQAPDHARHLRALVGLLRRLLRQRPAGPDADRPRLRRGLRRLRPADHADLAVGRLRARRPRRRPARDVHVGLLHGADVARRDSGDLDSGRARAARRRRARSAGRPADRRPGIQRVADPRRGPRDRGRGRLRPPPEARGGAS